MVLHDVTGSGDWSPQAAELEEGTLTLTARCPNCSMNLRHNLQSPPWHIPVRVIYEGQSDLLEAHRSEGSVEHEEVPEITTDLWCPRCEVRSEVTIAAR